MRLERTFQDGRIEEWWALEAERGPYGPEKGKRLVVASTDPGGLPERTTWYLRTNIPAPGSGRVEESETAPAGVAEVERLYGLRMWVEQSYKQVKQALGWAQYQVRSDLAIRRHWQLVCCAFSFCWWACADLLLRMGSLPGVVEKKETDLPAASEAVGRGKRKAHKESPCLLSWPAALRKVRAWLEPWVMLRRYWMAFSDKPPPKGLRALLDRVFSGRGLYLYAR